MDAFGMDVRAVVEAFLMEQLLTLGTNGAEAHISGYEKFVHKLAVV